MEVSRAQPYHKPAILAPDPTTQSPKFTFLCLIHPKLKFYDRQGRCQGICLGVVKCFAACCATPEKVGLQHISSDLKNCSKIIIMEVQMGVRVLSSWLTSELTSNITKKWKIPPPPHPVAPRLMKKYNKRHNYVQTVPNHRRLLIIDDNSLPHKRRRSFTLLLIFKIKFSSETPIRWLTGSAEMTPVIGNARRVRGEVTLIIELVD